MPLNFDQISNLVEGIELNMKNHVAPIINDLGLLYESKSILREFNKEVLEIFQVSSLWRYLPNRLIIGSPLQPYSLREKEK